MNVSIFFKIVLTTTLISVLNVSVAYGADQKKKSIPNPIEIKNTKLGMPLDEFKNMYSTLSCADDENMYTCHYYSILSESGDAQMQEHIHGYKNPIEAKELEKIADCFVFDWFFTFSNEKLVREEIVFANECYSLVALGFKQKFGDPSNTKNSKVKTKGGAEFNQVENTWASKEGKLTLEKYGTTIENSIAVLVNEEYLKRKVETIQKKAGDI